MFKSLLALPCFVLITAAVWAQPHSKLVIPLPDGSIVYNPYSERGDVIPDFSHCGYMGGGVDLPRLKVAATLSPRDTPEDDTPRIQRVIDSLAATAPDADGIRGAILLRQGVYRIADPIKLNASGIVLCGEGADEKSGTVFLATSRRKYSVIEIGDGRARLTPVSKEYPITDAYVPSGSRTVHVEGASAAFKPGDRIVVHRPSTAEWIRAIGMDSIAPRPLRGENTYESFRRFQREGASADMNGTVQWKPGTKDLLYERTVEAVDGDRLTLDIPVVNALAAEYGGAVVYKYEFSDRIERCGVENIFGMSVFDTSVTAERARDIGTYYSDENHANVFIRLGAAANSWVRDVAVRHFDSCVTTSPSTVFFTGQDLSATDPVSVITGGRRYAYSISGQMNLFLRCNAEKHRHPYVLGASVAGPNAFVDGKAELTFASAEPHQRWATGCLFDNIRISGPDGSLLAVNRSWYGSGHGWSGAQMVFWNCSAPVIMVMRPPTAQNFVIGSGGRVGGEWNERARKSTIGNINSVSRRDFRDTGLSAVGDGWIEYADQKVAPRSLYFMQLERRSGKTFNDYPYTYLNSFL